MTKKIKVGVVFGGQSAEHEVSLVSAASIMRAMDPSKYIILPFGITTQGEWVSEPKPMMKLREGKVRFTTRQPGDNHRCLYYERDTPAGSFEKEFQLMKPGAYLINASRGPVVNEKALVEALKRKSIAGAGLDVYENEPRIEPELLAMDNVVLLPHIGSASLETRTKMAMIAIENVLQVVYGSHSGGRPPRLPGLCPYEDQSLPGSRHPLRHYPDRQKFYH